MLHSDCAMFYYMFDAQHFPQPELKKNTINAQLFLWLQRGSHRQPGCVTKYVLRTYLGLKSEAWIQLAQSSAQWRTVYIRSAQSAGKVLAM